MPVFLQPSYAKGEVGADLYGRVDTAAIQVAVRTALNMIVHPYGGISNRPGQTFVAGCKAHSGPPLLIPFQYKTTDSYLLEFGDYYMRVIRNGALVTEAAKAITGITQANPGVVTAVGHGYSSSAEVYISSVYGMTEVNGNNFRINVLTVDTFELRDQVTGLGVNTSAFGAYSSGGAVAKVYEIVTPYPLAELQANVDTLHFVQNADMMTLTHRHFPVHELTRTSHTTWTLTPAIFGPSITHPLGQTVTPTVPAATTYSYRVTALKKDTLDESLPALNNASKNITAATAANPGVFTSVAHGMSNSDEVQIDSVAGTGLWATSLNGKRFTLNNVAANTFELLDENGVAVNTTTWGAYPGSGIARQTFVRITTGAAVASNTVAWSAVTGAEKYSVYKFDNGIYGFIGETSATTFLDDNIAADLSHSHPRARNPFSSADNYPGACTYYEQRRVFASTHNAPDTSWYSQVGRPSNMNVSIPLQDDDAITATLNSREVNEIRHLVPDEDLLAFTSGSEWKVNSGPDAAFTASSIKQRQQSNWGSGHMRPLTIGGTTLYLEESEASVRSFGFSFQMDKYTGNRIDILAPHLFEYFGLVSWTFAKTPEPRIYGVRADGQAVTLTFEQEQEVIAWTRWKTNGKYERVVAIRNPEGSSSPEHGVYFVVRRVINGNTVRYIERLASRRFQDVRDAFFVDCGLSYSSPIAITGITLANPAVITAPAHGLADGDSIDLFDISWVPVVNADTFGETQPDQLNTYRYIVRSPTLDTLQIEDADGNLVNSTAFNAYVEGGKVYKAVNSFTGFHQLNGANITALADGNVVRDLTATNGKITLPGGVKASRLHAGLSYVADFETLDIEAQQVSISGVLKKINNVIVRMRNSRSFLVGQTFDKMYEPELRDLENMGQPTAAITDTREFTMPADWTTQGRVCIRQANPLPVTILSTRTDISVAPGGR